MFQVLKQFWAEEHAASIVEYAILAALIAAVMIVIVAAVGATTGDMFSGALSSWQNA